jgi:hypothetical protein
MLLFRTPAPGVTITGGSVKYSNGVSNNVDITSFISGCVKAGTMYGQSGVNGNTFRCPIPGGMLPVGLNFISVVLNLSDGSQAGNTVGWNVRSNTEP